MNTKMTPTQALEALERVGEALQISYPQEKVVKSLLELPAAISALKAMVGEVDRCPITPASLALHQELFDMGRKHEQEHTTPLRPPVEQQTIQTVSLEMCATKIGTLPCVRSYKDIAKAVLDSLKAQGVEINYVD